MIYAYDCGNCGHEWESVWRLGFCPNCKSKNINRTEKQETEDDQGDL